MKVERMIWRGRIVYAKDLRWEGTWRVQGIKNKASMVLVLCAREEGWEITGGMVGATSVWVLPLCCLACLPHHTPTHAPSTL